MDLISGRSLMASLGEDEVVVVDCRDEAGFVALPLLIPGAVRMSCEQIHATPMVLPDDELIVLYDSEGVTSRCRRAERILELAGRRAAALEDGLRGWISRGYPTESGTSGRRPHDEPSGSLFIEVDVNAHG